MVLEHVSCDLCGCATYIEKYRKPDTYLWQTQFAFPIVACTNCDLVYVNPRPTFTGIAEFYPTDYHDNRDSAEHIRRYARQFEYVKAFEFEKILDVGCANGDWLEYVKQNRPHVEMQGVDAFSRGVKNNIKFYRCALTDADLPADYFELVTSWAVLEHVHTPLRYFQVVAQVLKPGGKFVFLVTNADSFYGRYAYSEDVPRHLYHFSKETLAAYADKVGLKLVRVDYDDGFWDGRGWGTFRYGLGRTFGFTWDKLFLKRLALTTKIAMRLGAIIDKIVFSTHWEAKLRRSGIIIATMEKVVR